MLYTGHRLDAREALRLGLVDHVVSRSQLLSKCEEIATAICKSAPLAVQKIKQAVRRDLDRPVNNAILGPLTDRRNRHIFRRSSRPLGTYGNPLYHFLQYVQAVLGRDTTVRGRSARWPQFRGTAGNL